MEPEREALEFQLEIVKMELETIESTIREMDDFCKNIKQWTIALWTGAIGGAISLHGLHNFVWLVGFIPLLFWLLDTWYRRIQRKFIWRSGEISRFLNSGGLTESFRKNKIEEFIIWDPQGRSSRELMYRQHTSAVRIMLFPSVMILYLGLIALSFAVQYIFWTNPSIVIAAPK